MAQAQKQARFQVICDRCYTFEVCVTNKQGDANRAATSHMNAYHHNVHINDRKGK